MKLSNIISQLEAEIHTSNPDFEMDICTACGSDLMSDVMAFSKENALLLTGLVNPQVIRTAEMMDIEVVVFVRGKKPQPVMIELANEKGIVLLSTQHPMFTACGKLHSCGILGSGRKFGG